jgi:hypothetical protein
MSTDFSSSKKGKVLIKTLVLFSMLAIVINACKHGVEPGCYTKNISNVGDDRSHNMGRNCMDCHNKNGEGEGCFVVAGTLFNSSLAAPLPEGQVKLFSGPGGTGSLVAVLDVDRKGNFFTTNRIPFRYGLYPAVTSKAGSTLFMSTPIFKGDCNSCHGVSNDPIFSM